jgi:serine/threonine protein kinase
MSPQIPRLADLSDNDRQELEAWLVEFDQRWETGLLVNRVQQIPPGSSWRLPALAEMVKIDLERQWARGHEISLESYLKQYPELGRADDVSADLIQAEYEVRKQFGAPVTLDDYLKRFPHQAAELGRLIAQGRSSLSRRSSASSPTRSSARTQGLQPTPEPLPRPFGRYRLLKRLGEGGMGSVYLAEDTALVRRVALKIPLFGPADDAEGRERFFREARAAATLDHPYLCPVYDVGEIDGQLYLTMAYIEGKSLAESLRGEGLPPRQVAALVGKLAVALEAAHAKGVIHRDLKPANVMIKETGHRREPVIVDFGLARREDAGEGHVTRTGQILGTLDYMAPEQIRGDQNAIGPACDIYALGVILYELLTGRRPFIGSGLAVAGQILTQDPLPPSEHRPGIDPRMEAICLKAMAKKIEDRYASMGAMAAALTDFLKAAPSKSAPEAPAPPSTGEATRKTGADSLVGQMLGQLADTSVPAPRPPDPNPVSAPPGETEPEPALELAGRPPRALWPIAIAASLFGLIALGVIIITIKTRNSETRITIPDGASSQVERKIVAYDPSKNGPARDGNLAGNSSRAKPPISPPLPNRIPPAGPARRGEPRKGLWTIEGDELIRRDRLGGARIAFGDRSWTDYDLTFEALPSAGLGFGAGFRLSRDPSGYQLWLGNAKFQGGSHALFDAAQAPWKGIRWVPGTIQPLEWYKVKISLRGQRIRVDLDDHLVFDLMDELHHEGLVSLHCYDSAARFRNIKVTAPDGTVLWEGPPDLPENDKAPSGSGGLPTSAIESPFQPPVDKSVQPTAPVLVDTSPVKPAAININTINRLKHNIEVFETRRYKENVRGQSWAYSELFETFKIRLVDLLSRLRTGRIFVHDMINLLIDMKNTNCYLQMVAEDLPPGSRADDIQAHWKDYDAAVRTLQAMINEARGSIELSDVPTDAFQPGSVWATESGPGPKSVLLVMQREGDRFQAKFVGTKAAGPFDNSVRFIRVNGTITGNKVTWLGKDVKQTKDQRFNEQIKNYNNNGTISKDRIFMKWSDSGLPGSGSYVLHLKKD